MLAIHGLNPRPALAYDLFLVSDNRVLSIFHLRLPAVLCVRFHAPVVIKKIDVALETASQKPIF
jgi:hypothetical protein